MSKKLISNGAVYLLSSVLTQLINLFLIPLYTRNLSVSEVGQYNIITSIQALIAIIITLGIFSGLCRFFNEVSDKNRLKNTTLLFSVFWGCFFIVLTCLLSSSIAPLLFKEDSLGDQYINIVIIISVMEGITSIYGSYFSMQFAAIKASCINISNMLFRFILSIVFIVILHKGIMGLLVAQCLASTLIVVCLLLYDRKQIKFEMNIIELKAMLKYGVGLVPGQVSVWILTLIDRYFIKNMIDLYAVGIYSMAYKIGMLINPVFILPFTRVFTPYKFSIYKEHDGKEKIKKIFNYYNFAGWLCILGLGLFSNIGITILATKEYEIGFKIVPLIAFSYYLWGQAEFYALGLHLSNKMVLNSGIATIGAIINVMANIAMIPFWGIYGAAWATIISYWIVNLIYFYIGNRYYNIGISLFVPYKFGIIVIVLYSIYLLLKIMVLNIFMEIVFGMILCLIYIGLCLVFKFISLDEVKILVEKYNCQISNKVRKMFNINK